MKNNSVIGIVKIDLASSRLQYFRIYLISNGSKLAPSIASFLLTSKFLKYSEYLLKDMTLASQMNSVQINFISGRKEIYIPQNCSVLLH
jgi:hypothetical protein